MHAGTQGVLEQIFESYEALNPDSMPVRLTELFIHCDLLSLVKKKVTKVH